jgi:protein-tyrosine phosphatase
VKLLSRIRRTPERLLHPWRRRRAQARIAGRVAPEMVLVVCHGNICRSPFGGLVLRRLLAPQGIRVESAGFIGPGRSAPPEAIEAAAARGVDLGEHRSRVLTQALVASAGLVVVMDAEQAGEIRMRFGRARSDVIVLGDLDPEPIATREILDPVYQPVSVFSEVYARIERCSARLAGALTG